MKGFALRLVLKQRHTRTQKWPIDITQNVTPNEKIVYTGLDFRKKNLGTSWLLSFYFWSPNPTFNALTSIHMHLTGGPPQQAPPVSVPGSMPGPPGGAMGAPMRGPPPPRPPMGSMPPGGMYSINDRLIVICELIKYTSCLGHS